jgi:WD40 repeat protein
VFSQANQSYSKLTDFNLQLMTLNYTLRHHTASINAVALNSDGDRLLSGGKSISLFSEHLPVPHGCTGDDADVVVWDTLTGEKVQVIHCAFHGPIGALVWVPQKPSLASGFAFGCADGSIHLYKRVESSVSDRVLLVDDSDLTFVIQTVYQYFAQDQVHDGPVLDLKYDTQFGRLASVGNGFPQVSELSTTDDGKLCSTHKQ